MEDFISYKQLQNESFEFYNSKLTQIPKSYIIRLNKSRQIASKRLKCNQKKKIIRLIIAVWMQLAIISYDLYNRTSNFSNTRYVEILNNFEKICNTKYLDEHWLRVFDWYFKDDVSQSPIIVYYGNYNKLKTT